MSIIVDIPSCARHRGPFARICLLLASALLAAAPLQAAERIALYDVRVEVADDGRLDITEAITVRAEGNRIRRGIYRDFPTRYRDRYGNNVVVDFELLEVLRDGAPEPHFTERVDNGVRINTGDDDFLPVPDDFTFTLRYRTARQLGFFEQHDELYWNATGVGWVFPIDQARVEIRLPEPVAEESLAIEAYTGPEGAQGTAYRAWVEAPGVVLYETTRGLRSNEGITVVLGFPKGIVSAPTGIAKARSFVADNAGAGVALFGFAAVLVFYLRRWNRLGRDPRPGVIFPHYQPPDGLSPALLRYVWKMGYEPRCFAADLVELAVRGLVEIDREKTFLKQRWTLRRTQRPIPEDLPAGQRVLLGRLFSAGSRIELDQANHVILGSAKEKHTEQLKQDAEPRYFVSNLGTVGLGALMSVAVIMLAFALSADGGGIVVVFLVVAGLVATNVVFLRLMRCPTAEGRQLIDKIEGLKQYLSVAERDELRGLSGPNEPPPPVDAERYERLLPYALALDVEDAWTGRFIAAVGTAAAAEAAVRIGWYHGGGSIANLGEVSSALGSSLSSSISSSSSPPGSSSGGGGGGSSGGGGGGGGGGGR
jgi:uncharacterized membrane protein YgcG